MCIRDRCVHWYLPYCKILRVRRPNYFLNNTTYHIMKQNILIVFSLLGMLTFTSSCSEKLDLTPISSISDANLWQSPEQVDVFVTGIHTRFRSNVAQFQYLGGM